LLAVAPTVAAFGAARLLGERLTSLSLSRERAALLPF